ncbi:MAG TPA: serine/threonine-protein kinase [Gemmatimonadales bacterium]|nr:serine/threonine-protein kinase [Gemmatimonadales bacterium]
MTRLSARQAESLLDTMRSPGLPDRYRLEAVIGRGGMGVVWRGHDRILDRTVAVKVVAEHLEGDAYSERLQRESRILATLEHPGIIPVHDAGILDDGRAWYAMRLVDGTRLDQAIATFQSLAEALSVMARIAETVAFAHSRGVLHRDLTPANVMIGPFGEILILDWGLASAGMVEAAAMGTPGYRAPEQEAGFPADERSDVHGLGAIIRDLVEAWPEAVPAALPAIRDRAMAVDPEQRYRTALELRDDLNRLLAGERVSAYRERPLEMLARITRPYHFAMLLVLAYLAMRIAILWWRGI